LSRTATPCPARRATSVAGTPAFSHSDTAACRRSYGRRPSGDLYWAGMIAYRPSKTALNELTVLYANALADDGFKVNALAQPAHARPSPGDRI
jgi:NAD(P)-dependent dehydrogenase (short-subunit alcohol dehydrogenase family)